MFGISSSSNPSVSFPPFNFDVSLEAISDPGFACLISDEVRKPLSLDTFLATDVSGYDVLLGVPPEFFSAAVQHYYLSAK